MGVDGQRHVPAALPVWKRRGTPCTRGRAGLGAGLDGCGKSFPPHPVGFEPMTVQPVASRYTDFAIPPAVCRPKYPLKIQFLPHRQQIASPLQRWTFVSVLSTGVLMVRGKLTSLSCCLLLFMEIVAVYCKSHVTTHSNRLWYNTELLCSCEWHIWVPLGCKRLKVIIYCLLS